MTKEEDIQKSLDRYVWNRDVKQTGQPEWNLSREAWEEHLRSLLSPLLPFYSEGAARLRIGATNAHYEVRSQEMEAFARPLWGFAPYLYGHSPEEKLPPEMETFLNLYRTGLVHGTDPTHPEYWGKCHDFDQKFCEMPAISLFLLLNRERVWDSFSEKEKEQIGDWLNEINRHDCCACNWYFFSIMTNVALYKLGLPYDEAELQNGLSLIDSYYDGGGWYKDGNGGDKDYYNPYVMLTFGLFYRQFMEKEDPERCARYLARALQFGKDYQYWFSDAGECFSYGRSMTYRFASVSFYACSVLFHVEPLPTPVMKGILYRNLYSFLQLPILDSTGLLTIGYGYPNLQMSESYNGPGSPYWALMAFLFLGLPKEDPFWSIEPAPMPELPPFKYLSHVPMLLQRSRENAHQVVALVPGKSDASEHGHMVEKYSKFAYSSAFSFSIARSQYSLSECAPDSTLVFVWHGMVYVKTRTAPGARIDAQGMIMHWEPIPGVQVKTTIFPTEKGHKRMHEIDNTSGESIEAYDLGFSVPFQEETDSRYQEYCDEASGCSELHSFIGYCRVERDPASGLSGTAEILIPAPNTNLLYPKTKIPMMHYRIPEGHSQLTTVFSYL